MAELVCFADIVLISRLALKNRRINLILYMTEQLLTEVYRFLKGSR